MKEFFEFLTINDSMHLSTVGSEGPHVAAVFYVLEQRPFRLIFMSARETRHIQEILRDCRAAVAVSTQNVRVSEIRGAQLWGRVLAPRDPAECFVRYLARFEGIESHLPTEVFSHLWEFRVERARWIDNRRGFGHRVEWKVSKDGLDDREFER